MNAIFRRFFLRGLFLAAGLLPLAVVHAQSTAVSSQTLDFRLNGNSDPWTNPGPNGPQYGTTQTLPFAAFDTSLGTLQSVSLDFTATQRYVLGAYQTGGQGNNHYLLALDPATVRMAGGTFQLPAAALTGVSPGVYDPAAHGNVSTDSLLTAAYNAFLAGGDPTFPDGAKLAGCDTITGTVDLPLNFGGVLALVHVVHLPGLTTLGTTGGNNDAQSMVDLFGSATLTYGYTAIPEPATAAGWAGAAAALFALFQRRRRSPSATA